MCQNGDCHNKHSFLNESEVILPLLQLPMHKPYTRELKYVETFLQNALFLLFFCSKFKIRLMKSYVRICSTIYRVADEDCNREEQKSEDINFCKVCFANQIINSIF